MLRYLLNSLDEKVSDNCKRDLSNFHLNHVFDVDFYLLVLPWKLYYLCIWLYLSVKPRSPYIPRQSLDYTAPTELSRIPDICTQYVRCTCKVNNFIVKCVHCKINDLIDIVNKWIEWAPVSVIILENINTPINTVIS